MASHYPTMLLLMDKSEEGEPIVDDDKNYPIMENFLKKEGFEMGPWSFEMGNASVTVWDKNDCLDHWAEYG